MSFPRFKLCLALIVCGGVVLPARALVTYTDDFSLPVNYLTNGVAGTIWDGIYLGADEIANATGLGAAPGSVSVANANISSNNALTVASVHTDWENNADDGFLLFKVITGDFDMSVRILGPIDTGAYNFPGLMVRAFGPNGSPLQPTNNAIAENSLLWGRFDQFNIANMSKNNVNGVKTDIGRGTYPNTNYWLRMTRSGNVFRLFEKPTQAAAWTQVGSVTRPDFSGVPLQVGIEHSTYGGGVTRVAHYASFSLTVTNMGPFATPPQAPRDLVLSTNSGGTLDISWTPGAGSAGSLVVMWPGTNSTVKHMPANGFSYTGNASYGLGSPLPGAGYFVVYSGAGTNVTVNNLPLDTVCNVAVFSYAGAGTSMAYNRTPAVGSVVIPPNQVRAQINVDNADVVVWFTANPGKWYRLQYTDSLAPVEWHDVEPGPVYATDTVMAIVHRGGALAPQRYYRVQQSDPLFNVRTSMGGITSLKRTGDVYPTEYIAGGGRLGDVIIRYRQASDPTWRTFRTSAPGGVATVTYTTNGAQYKACYTITNALAGPLIFESVFDFLEETILWSLNFTNLSGQVVVIGDLAVPLPMNSSYSGETTCAMKHSFISGNGSFVFWMRPNSVGPYLLLTPTGDTGLEFWDTLNGYEVYIHSYVAGTNAAAQYPAVTTQGERWRQPNTALTLDAGASRAYGFKLQWVDDYAGVRQALVNEGKIDVHIVPGMTIPTNLFALIALNTTQQITSVRAEFPSATQVQYLGATGTYQLYKVQFARLGENKLTVEYGNSQRMYLEFFVTEPLETLIKKRAAFLAATQVVTNRWYNGLFAEWNMNSQELVTPDNYSTITGWRIYIVASDDAGLSRPAYLALKNAVYPVQAEVSALDYYISNFVWGGLQRTTNETYSYGIYGIPNWYENRTSSDPGPGGQLHLWRIYDYPHVIAMYYGMYQIAKYHPEIATALHAGEYLRRAYGTAVALYTVPYALVGWSAYYTGLMNELVIVDLIEALEAEGMTNEAATLRAHWEQKVNYFVTNDPDLFGSEYSFDSTGFEAQQAIAKYAVQHADTLGATNPAAYLAQARQFMHRQIAANIFARGWLEPAYYHYGSDFRQQMGDVYTLSYMSQMGGWAILDYALHFSTNAAEVLRLGYASILSAWATMNSGPPPDYGFWYPGAANDGACGGGFEPLPYNTTWLGQPMHRGVWYYSCEENLGYCGALRAAATILADDPIFGRICYGGISDRAGGTNQVVLLDGVRRRFHAMLDTATLHMVLDNDRFAAGAPVVCTDDLSLVTFCIETEVPMAHTATLHLTVSVPGTYTISNNHGIVTTTNLVAGQEAVLALPIDGGATAQPFSISR